MPIHLIFIVCSIENESNRGIAPLFDDYLFKYVVLEAVYLQTCALATGSEPWTPLPKWATFTVTMILFVLMLIYCSECS